jgi:hypothetical protein
MAWQRRWVRKTSFKVDAIWFDYEALASEKEADLVPYVLEECPWVENLALSEMAYCSLPGRWPRLDTSRISKLTILGNNITRSPSAGIYWREQRNPSHIFPNVTHLVLYNILWLDDLHLPRHPNLTHVAVCHYSKEPGVWETTWILDRIRNAPHLQRVVLIFHRSFKPGFVNWIIEHRKNEKRLYIVESILPGERIYNDKSWWRTDVMQERSIWERAEEFTAANQKGV